MYVSVRDSLVAGAPFATPMAGLQELRQLHAVPTVAAAAIENEMLLQRDEKVEVRDRVVDELIDLVEGEALSRPLPELLFHDGMSSNGLNTPSEVGEKA